MNKLRTALVGCGKIANAHALAYKELNDSEFVAVCDINESNSIDFAKKYDVNAYTNVSEMIEKENIDVVSICTPHPFHVDGCVEAAKNGANVIVEKPFSVKLNDCNRMIEAGKEYNVKIGTLFQRRYYEPCIRMKNAIDNGKIGKPILGSVNMLGWRDKQYYNSDPWRGTWKGEGGGVLPTQACHQLDLLLWFMDSEIDVVYGAWRNFNHPYIEVEDTAVAVIEFKNGSLATISVSNSQNPALYGKVHIHGENGASIGVQTDGGAMFIAGMTQIEEAPFNDIWTVKDEECYLEEWKERDEEAFFSNDPETYYHKVQISSFLKAVKNGNSPEVDGYDGRNSVELMTAIYESTRTKEPVKFPISEN